MDVVTGAGFDVEDGSVAVSGDEVRLRAVRARTLADTVGAGDAPAGLRGEPLASTRPMPASATPGRATDSGRPRWTPASWTSDRDPVDALVGHGVGMTDFVKRPTRTAAEVTPDEYRAGFARVERLVEWLRPGAVCFTGLSGWRTTVDPKAVAGLQPERDRRAAGLRDAVDQRPQCPDAGGRAGRAPPGGVVAGRVRITTSTGPDRRRVDPARRTDSACEAS